MSLPTLPDPKGSIISTLQTAFNGIGLPTAAVPVVQDAYPQKVAQIQQHPRITVREVNSAAARRFIGGQMLETIDAHAGTASTTRGYMEESGFEVIIWTANEKLRDALSLLLKYILNEEAVSLSFGQAGMPWVAVKSGAAEEAEDEDGGRVLFLRPFVLLAWYFITEVQIGNLITEIRTNFEFYTRSTDG